MVFKNPRDQTQNRHLACQMFPSKPKFLQAAYEEETKDPYGYFFLDFHPNSPEFARVRGNFFPFDLLEDPCCLYLQRDMQIQTNFTISSLCIKEPAHLTKYSFELELDYVKSYNSYMANVKSDELKQSIDNLEKYRLFMEDKLKLFIHKEFDRVVPCSARSWWKEKCIIYSHS